MRKHGWYGRVRRIAPLALALVCGCRFVSPHMTSPAEERANTPGALRGPAHIMPPVTSVTSATFSPALSTAPFVNDQVSLSVQRVAQIEDDKKILQGRLQQIEAQIENLRKELEEKDRLVSQANTQIQESIRAVEDAREEIIRLKSELQNERKSHKETLQKLIKVVEEQLKREPPVAPPDDQGPSFSR